MSDFGKLDARPAGYLRLPPTPSDPIQVHRLLPSAFDLASICHKLVLNLFPLSYPRPQALFVTKIQEYATKKAAAGGSMVDAYPATEAELKAELDKVTLSLILIIHFLIVVLIVLTILITRQDHPPPSQVAKQYGGGAGVDMTAFAEVAFAEPALDPINLAAAN